LYGVLGLGRVAQHYQGETVGFVDQWTEQGIKRLSAACGRLPD